MHIVTVTLNPCIDKSTAIARLLPEKKLRCTRPVLEPGGGGINVSRAIKKIGGEATAVYLSGGYNGALITRLLEQEGIAGISVFIKNETRENTVVLDSAANVQYRFCMPGPDVEEDEWQSCLNVLEGMAGVDYIVTSGSLPPNVPPNIIGCIARYAKAKNIKLAVDTSGAALSNAFDEGVYLAKPNMTELCEYAGVERLTMASAGMVCQEIVSNGKCEIIMLSMGEAGALLVTKNILMHITPPAVERKSTVGAGDSMMAGIVFSLAKGWDIIDAAKYGVASGTAATLSPGTQLCHLKDVEAIYAQMKAS